MCYGCLILFYILILKYLENLQKFATGIYIEIKGYSYFPYSQLRTVAFSWKQNNLIGSIETCNCIISPHLHASIGGSIKTNWKKWTVSQVASFTWSWHSIFSRMWQRCEFQTTWISMIERFGTIHSIHIKWEYWLSGLCERKSKRKGCIYRALVTYKKGHCSYNSFCLAYFVLVLHVLKCGKEKRKTNSRHSFNLK